MSQTLEDFVIEPPREQTAHLVGDVLARVISARDATTSLHQVRVAAYALLIGEAMQLSTRELYLLRIGAPLHDIGKIGIDDAILRKPGRLTPAESAIMKTHVVMGTRIIEQVVELRDILPIVRSHHERWDGGGYPDRLAGEQIHVLARIVAVADAFDAMTADRPYRRGMPVEVAFSEIERHAGKHFCPTVTAAFLGIRPAIEQLLDPDALVPAD
jgi:HD-GYP domain-containing protein (c-di-GMP phosphodiesterase class II)